MNRIVNAVDKFVDEYACSQAILSEFGERYGLDQTMALRLASGFAGGMSMAKTCGAVTGAYMVLGLHFGDADCSTPEGRKEVYKAVLEFTGQFRAIFGTVECAKLLGHDISTPQGMEAVKEQDLFQTICPNVVKTSARFLEKLIEKTNE